MKRAGIRNFVVGVGIGVLALAGGVIAGQSVQAQSRYSSYGYDQYRHEGQKIGYDKGYRMGLDRGDDDARHHRTPDPERSSHYRNADDGYHHEYGPKEEYRESYRDGFRQGYSEAFRRYGRY